MRSGDFKRAVDILLLVVVLFFSSYCASKPDLIGKWREFGKTATIEFSKDGTFRAVDNQGMAVSGKYVLSKDTHLRCEIEQKGGPAEIIDLTVSIKRDELTLSPSDSWKVEVYKRQK